MGTIGIEMNSKTIKEIRRLYAEIDRHCLSFCLATGLRCLEGCGVCCSAHKVEAQPLELLPAIVALHKKGEMEQWLTRLSSGSVDSGTCLFYTSEIVSGGHCLIYNWRPVMCRLFNFAVFTRKDGQGIFQACKPLQDARPDLVQTVQEKIAGNLAAPRLTQYAMQVFGIDGNAGLVPINHALKIAIERYGLQLELLGKEREGRLKALSGKGFSPSLAA